MVKRMRLPIPSQKVLRPRLAQKAQFSADKRDIPTQGQKVSFHFSRR